MNKNIVLLLCLFFICILSEEVQQTQKKIIFLYHGEKQLDHTTLSEIQKNHNQYPIFTVNCDISNCQKYKVTQYPALIFWNGPGTSFKKLSPANNEGLQNYFKAQKEHPLKALRDFMQRISLLQSFGVAILVATFLYIIFSFLFKDRTGLQAAKSKKDL